MYIYDVYLYLRCLSSMYIDYSTMQINYVYLRCISTMYIYCVYMLCISMMYIYYVSSAVYIHYVHLLCPYIMYIYYRPPTDSPKYLPALSPRPLSAPCPLRFLFCAHSDSPQHPPSDSPQCLLSNSPKQPPCAPFCIPL